MASQNDVGAAARARSPQEADERIRELESQNTDLRRMIVEMQATAEREGEFISNRLLKRIDDLKNEKERLLMQVEREEEYLTNTLQKQLAKLRQEKIDLEATMEREQELLVNRLQRQADQHPTVAGRRSSSASDHEVPALLAGILARGGSTHTTAAPAERAPQVEALLSQQEALIKSLREELAAERRRADGLQAQHDALKESKAALQLSAEQEGEYISNTLLRRIQGLQNDKASLLGQLRHEEEHINQMLARRVTQLSQEKQQLEAALVQERSQIEERVARFASSVGATGVNSTAATISDFDSVRKELDAIRHLSSAVEANLQSRCDSLQSELNHARGENIVLRQRIMQEAEALQQLAQSKIEPMTPGGEDSDTRSRSGSGSGALRRMSNANASSGNVPPSPRTVKFPMKIATPVERTTSGTSIVSNESGGVAGLAAPS